MKKALFFIIGLTLLTLAVGTWERHQTATKGRFELEGFNQRKKANSSEKQIKAAVEVAEITPAGQTSRFEKSGKPIIHDLSKIITWHELDSDWNTELQELLHYLVEDEAVEIYEAYQKEISSHKEALKEASNHEELHRQHSLKMQMIFGQYFTDILDYRMKYLEQKHQGAVTPGS